MRSSTIVRWLAAFLCYWIVAFGLLAFFLDGDFFCARDGGSVLVAAKLSLAAAVFDSILSVAIERSLYAARQASFGWLGASFTALIVGVLVAALPAWIYQGYGAFRFGGTWASVSCAFTEGYGIAFPVAVAPALALATFIKATWLMRAALKTRRG